MNGSPCPLAVLLVASLAVALQAGCTAAQQAVPTIGWDERFVDLPRADVLLGGSGDGDAVLTVAAVVADTPEARTRGLQGVMDVPAGTGMLFVFPGRASVPEDRSGFWMLDTAVPLDIAFAADGIVVGVATMSPCAAAPCPITHPAVPYDVALEVAAGVLGEAGVGTGDRFTWRVTAEPVGGAG